MQPCINATVTHFNFHEIADFLHTHTTQLPLEFLSLKECMCPRQRTHPSVKREDEEQVKLDRGSLISLKSCQ